MGPRPRAKAARAAAPDRRALDPTRSGPVRAAPPHPLRDGRRAAPLALPSVCVAATPRVDSPHRTPCGRGPGYGGVEDPPMPLYATLACAALTVITFLAVPRRESRLARLRRAQERWAEQMDPPRLTRQRRPLACP